MKLRAFHWLLLWPFISLNVDAQHHPSELKIGDTIPDSVWNLPLQVVNHPKGQKTITLNDYRGKLIILDFWATWCSPCIDMFPKTDSLQKQFEEKVQFLPVTYQDKKEVKGLLDKLEAAKNIKMGLTIAVSDTLLRRCFPHRELPHYVWINDRGMVQAITGFREVNADNLVSVLQRKLIPLKAKVDETRIPYDKSKPLFINGNGGDGSALQYQSLISGYTPGIGGGWKISESDSIQGRKMVFYNKSITGLFRFAFGEDKQWLAGNRVILETKDTSELVYDKTKEWIRANTYCYELIVPPFMSSDAFRIMRRDLLNFFDRYDVRLEKRKTKCLVLTRISEEDKLHTSGSPPEVRFSPFGCRMVNTPLSRFIIELDTYYLQKSPFPIVDGTGYRRAVDMEINAPLSDVTAMNKELARYGLAFIEAVREIDMLVIRDKKTRSL